MTMISNLFQDVFGPEKTLHQMVKSIRPETLYILGFELHREEQMSFQRLSLCKQGGAESFVP
jgi:hypothetical protein